MHATLAATNYATFGNVVVLRSSADRDAYGPYIQPLGPYRSVRTIAIPPCATRAQIDALAPLVDGADAVFFAGGDQAHYVAWKGSALIEAVRRVWQRGGVVGGTSAGLAIQGEYAFDSVSADRLHADDDDYSVNAANALGNPWEPEISFTSGLFDWPPLQNVITDTHFAKRDRFGRAVAFLAQLERARHLPTGTLYALAVDERSAVVVNARGIGRLLEYAGEGYRTRGAWLMHLVSVDPLDPGLPLRATVEVLHLARPGATIDLVRKTGQGRTYRVTVDGSRTPPYADPYR
jgi:cyanophycinase-like exopeptidase